MSEEESRWREIIENFGDRARLEPGDLADDDDPAVARPFSDPPEEGYRPPEPPPARWPEGVQGAAWVGALGAPVVLLALTLVGRPVPGWVVGLLIVAFVGGFGYLVAQLPRGPRDPGDDGAQV